MAEKTEPVKKARFKLASDADPSAGGAGGGGDGDGAAAPAPAPRREPPSSPPRSPSPPEPFTYDFGDGSTGGGAGSSAGGAGGGGDGEGIAAPASALRWVPPPSRWRPPPPPTLFTYNPEEGSSGGGGGAAAPPIAPQPEPSSPQPSSQPPPDDYDDDDEEDYKGFKDERESGSGTLYMSDPQVLFKCWSDPQNPPRYIGRQGCEPLITQDFFSLRHNWEQLLAGKRTYLCPPKNNRVAKGNDDKAFVTPKPPELALQCQVPLSDFVCAAAKDSIVQQKFKILSEHYVWIRQMRIDGSSFYRAFLFSYLENLGRMQGSQAEVTRLMECMARFRKNFCHLHWDSAYFINPGAFFSSVVSEFKHLVNSVASGLNADELYKRSLQEPTSSRILCLLRLLTEVHIRTHHADYNYQQTEALKDPKDSDDQKTYEFQTRNGRGSLFMSDPEVLSMYSSDPQNLPHYIGRQNCELLTRQKFLSLHHNWRQLLDGKNTYLRPPKNNCVAKDNYDNSNFVTPKAPELAVRPQEPLVLLAIYEAAGIIQQKYKILCEHYVRFRGFRDDGSQFYRAFLFSYLENLGKMQCSQAEVTRLMECVARSRENFCRLQWNNAYFSNPKAFFSSVVSEFEDLVNSVANGLNADERYMISLEDISSSRILSLLRLLAEVHIRTHEADYNKLLDEKDALSFCIESVRPFGAGIELLQIRALSQALGIPVHVAVVDNSVMEDGTVQVLCLDFIPQSESGVSRTSGSLSSTRVYYLSSATDKHPVLPAGNLFLSDRMPLVTIFMTSAKAIAILYRK